MINDMTVGMENLPNVFINKIHIKKINNVASEITVTINMYDSDFPKNSWRSKPGIDLKLHVSFVKKQSTIQDLNNGIVSLH